MTTFMDDRKRHNFIDHSEIAGIDFGKKLEKMRSRLSEENKGMESGSMMASKYERRLIEIFVALNSTIFYFIRPLRIALATLF